ncbi:hypothetical protein BIFGAL_03313 [Bifidobacterium gallicum DSM 20093 = LMG 11596]|uniref:Uncharacterized protein n=1 Tax=Bifidobacterium gallicum DSM 20093 = LMG 11596 TaxID=561180 RepID=D1NTZ2_9BIFI|nr:hypothetical protein BIFGAL_03313 [Bifidobacterium gallicum DSM 20093 = LMG 11596]
MTSSTSSTITAKPRLKWRVADIAVASVIGVASALIYWVVAIASSAPWGALEAVLPGMGGLINGLWLFAGPLAAIIVRKPGAAIYAEVIAGILEALLGNQWGGVGTVLIALDRVWAPNWRSRCCATANGTLVQCCCPAHWRAWGLGAIRSSRTCRPLT